MKISLNNKKIIGLIVIAIFIIWMLFFDTNSYLYQLNSKQEIEQLEKSIDFYKTQIKKNKKTLKDLSVQKNLNDFAREQYHYKKKDEFLYLIAYDTLEK